MIFDQVEAEKIDFKDTKGHFHFSHFQVILSQFKERILKINFFIIFFVNNWIVFVENITDKDGKFRFKKSRGVITSAEIG